MFYCAPNEPMRDPYTMESVHEYQEREADEARQEQRIADYNRFVHPQHAEPEESEDQNA